MAREKLVRLQADKAFNLHKDIPGKELSGYYLGFKMVDGKFGPQKLHFLEGENGNIGVWGFPDLNDQLAKVVTESLKGQATMVYVKSAGVAPAQKGFQPKRLASVERDRALTREVGGTEDAGSEPDYSAEDEGADYVDNDGDDASDSAPITQSLPKGRAAPVNAQAAASTAALLARARANSGRSA